MESAANRLQKEAKGYLDSLRGLPRANASVSNQITDAPSAMTASQMRIAETIDAFYGDAGANDGVSRSYKQAVEDLDAETIKALDGPFRYKLTRVYIAGISTNSQASQSNRARAHIALLRVLPGY